MTGTVRETRSVSYELEIEIEGSRERIWEAMTSEINNWWLPDFHMLGTDSTVSFDTKAGGQLVETRADGSSLLWYTVQMCTPGESIYLVGSVAPEWGGPSTTMLKLAIEENNEGCVLRISDAIFGHISDATVQSLSGGWRQLFGALKEHVER